MASCPSFRDGAARVLPSWPPLPSSPLQSMACPGQPAKIQSFSEVVDRSAASAETRVRRDPGRLVAAGGRVMPIPAIA
jgi:hypothetical protein